jgi:hypothetical protein
MGRNLIIFSKIMKLAKDAFYFSANNLRRHSSNYTPAIYSPNMK